MMKVNKFVEFVREQYKTEDFIPLHVPTFSGNEKKYLNECIDSTFVSSVGKFVNQFEEELQQFANSINNNTTPLVSIHDGYNALDVAHKIVEKLKISLSLIED